MPRPLLTDDIIEQAQREKLEAELRLRRELEEDEELAQKYDQKEEELAKQAVYKSRRIENVKVKERSKKLNKWLWIILLVALLLLVLFVLYYFTNL
ncbi:cell wall synthase accessory phosphoprotein MacP [Lactococcus termiticola]|uniref:Uncharacterized protein n=1 Tax=Lactococcus termiticola TaxID=2169526 RepID=A0A2R5HKF7_9LACT|nr:cell wall synthase accessory phosphoprotein MacP [Lactococcus termiticola]GBG97031.1 hypothetical protein NtB2_01168 [Lactococcus termiticola]